MYIDSEKIEKVYYRTSKHGIKHRYVRKVTSLNFVCDNCGNSFSRLKGNVSPKRLDNRYYHCCANCNSKQFAQRKGVEKRLFWNTPVSSTTPINHL